MNEDINKVIKDSCLFDSTYYLARYEDIKRRQNEPLRHYLRHGHKEDRNPNAFFDTKLYREKYLKGNKDINPLYHYLTNVNASEYKVSESFDGAFYLKHNPDVKLSGMNPLVHYLSHGVFEGRKGVEIKNTASGTVSFPSLTKDIRQVKVTIIVPVYNAIEEVKDCIDSVIRNTQLGTTIDLLVLNDCSPDRNVKKELNKYKGTPGIRIKHNFKNLGYTKNVNKGLSLTKNNDVILLNSDTVVTPNWMRNLISSAYQGERIGTVTAVSNNSGAFSVPQSGTNDIPDNLSIDAISRIVSSVNGGSIDVPTGNGFCLYIKRELINTIGNFDESKFPKGYGEENEFCMRAVDNGWNNIIDTKTYIYHKRSASFKESKYKLMEEGFAQVVKSYPEYEGAIKAIGSSEKFKKIRSSIQNEIEASSNLSQISKPKLMFVISTRSGGTPQTNLDLMRNLNEIYDCYALASNSGLVEILKAGKDGYEVVEQHQLTEKVKYATHRSGEYEKLVKYLIYKYNIELLHIRHICWHSLLLPKLAKELMIPVVNSFHDFYAICPTVNLIDNDGNHFEDGVVDNAPNPLWRDETVRPMSKNMLDRWQKRMDTYLSECDHFITTCESAKKILLSKLPNIKKKSCFDVISHGRDFDCFIKPKYRGNEELDKIKVLVPGNITKSKGAELIKEIKSLDKNNTIEFHVIGSCQEDLEPYIVNHGTYKREDFQSLVQSISPNISAVFSIWPETYCHTLTESWASGLPVVGLAYGAVEERINKHKAGWLVGNNASECFKLLDLIRTDNQEYNEKAKSLSHWQNDYGRNNNVSRMTGCYVKIYQDLLRKEFVNANHVNKKLGFIMKGSFPDVPPTAYVRLVDWKDYFEKESGKKVEFFHWSCLLTSTIDKCDEYIIQRDAIPGYAVEWCLDILKKNNIKYTYEIDDNLLDVPHSVDPDGVYKAYRPFIEKLISNADVVHVTNNDLASVVSKYNDNVVLRPNEIFDSRWKADVDMIDLSFNKDKINILYYGSRTHQTDLNFLLSVIDAMNETTIVADLYVIGCGDFSPRDYVHRLTPPSGRYDQFVEWLIAIAPNFDVGVAPLIDASFAKNKSYLKCIEMSSLNLKVVCSNVKPYTDLKNLSSSMYKFSDNNIQSWKNELLTIKNVK